MKHLLAFALLLASCAAPSQEQPREMAIPDPARPVAPHPFLEQLVGDWSIEHRMAMGPEEERLTMHARESVRAMGPWIVSTIVSDGPMGHIEANLALAEDPDAPGEFHGTWVDSTAGTLWIYRGWLDDTGTMLTLEAEGPAFDDPTKTALYRDVTELLGDGHRALRSSVRMDGEWVAFVEGEARRN